MTKSVRPATGFSQATLSMSMEPMNVNVNRHTAASRTPPARTTTRLLEGTPLATDEMASALSSWSATSVKAMSAMETRIVRVRWLLPLYESPPSIWCGR